MSNIRTWFECSMEEQESPIIVQDGETPEEDPSVATNDEVDVEVAKPEVAEIPAASEEATKHKEEDHQHQKVISHEEVVVEEPVVEVEVPEVVEDTVVDVTDTIEESIEPTAPAEGDVTEDVEPLELELMEQDGPEDKVTEVVQDIDRFVEVSEGLEGYMTLIQDLTDKGVKVSREHAYLISSGMEMFQVGFESDAFVASLEGMDDDQDYATVSMEQVESNFKKILEAGRKAIAKLFEILYDLWTQATGGVARARKRLDKVAEAIKTLDGTPPNKEIEISGVGRLSIDGKFVGLDVSSLKSLEDTIDYCYNWYPKSINAFTKYIVDTMDTYEKKVLMTNDKEAGAALFLTVTRAISSALPRPGGYNKLSGSDKPNGFRKEADVYGGPVLPGNKRLAISSVFDDTLIPSGDAGSNQLVEIFTKLHQMVRIELVDVQGSNINEVSVKVPSKVELERMAKGLQGLVKTMSNDNKAKSELRDTKKIIDGKLTRLKYQVLTFATPTYRSISLQTLSNLSKLATRPSGQVVGYVTSTLNAYVSVLAHCVEQYSKGEAQTQAALPAPA